MSTRVQLGTQTMPKYLSDNIELIKKRCMKTIFPGYSSGDILEMTNLPTLHVRCTTLCRAYFNKMNRSNHELNALLPGLLTVPYALRASNGLPVPSRRQTDIKIHLYRGVYQTARTA